MNEHEQINSIVREEREGLFTVTETCWRIFCVVDGRNLPEVMRRLPQDWRDEFGGWAHRNLGNDQERAELLSIYGADHPRLEEALAAVRSWLASG